MATRLRFSETLTAAVSPTAQSYTHDVGVRKRLARSDSSTLTTTAYAPDAADHLVAGDSHITQFVSDPMVNGTVFTSGNTLKMAMQFLEANNGNNLFLQLWVGVVSLDGATARGTLRSKVSHGTETPNSITNRFLSTTLSSSYTTANDGDRLVVEISHTGTPVNTGGVQGHNFSLRRGNSGAGGDLAENDTDTGATINPWIEFATTITWDDKSVTPGLATLTLTAFTPVVTATNNKLATPGLATLTTTRFAPTVSAPRLSTPGLASLTTTRFTPTVASPRLSTPGLATLTTTAFTPTVTVSAGGGVTAIPGTASLTTTRYAPTVLAPRLVTPGLATLALTRFTPTVTAPQLVTPGTATLTLTRFTPTVSAPRTTVPGAASLTTTRYTPTVTTGTLLIGGIAPTITSHYQRPKTSTADPAPAGAALTGSPTGSASQLKPES